MVPAKAESVLQAKRQLQHRCLPIGCPGAFEMWALAFVDEDDQSRPGFPSARRSPRVGSTPPKFPRG